MTRALMAASLFAAIGLPCGTVPGVPDVGLGDARDVARRGGEATQEAAAARERCENTLRGKPVAYEEERSIGGAVAIEFIRKGKIRVDPPPPASDATAKLKELRGKPTFDPPDTANNKLNAYVNELGMSLAQRSERPTIGWTFGVIDASEPNAFSAPGGYVLVTTGMLKTVENEAQLAGVLAHEITHITRKHALASYSDTKVEECKANATSGAVANAVAGSIRLDFGMGNPGGFIPLDDIARSGTSEGLKFVAGFLGKGVANIVSAGNSREQEFEADGGAQELMIAAGYNPDELQQIIARLPEGEKLSIMKNHASNADRIKSLKEKKAAMKPVAGSFGYMDWPFSDYKVPPLPEEVKKI